RGLLASLPRLSRQKQCCRSIPGQASVLHGPPAACSFAPRCPVAQERCQRENPPLRPLAGGQVRCFYPCS
ncbi:MAG: oligopeptide/dipeptide ABC transporter ATP-binding protein, partial [Bacillota bacterium]